MIDVESFFTNKPAIPDWVKTHPIWKDVKKVNKIFPSIGLPNFTIESNLENNNTSLLIKNLCYTMSSFIGNAKYYFEDQQRKVKATTSKKSVQKEITDKYAPFISICNQFLKQVAKSQPFIKEFKEKNGLYLQKDIVDIDAKIFAKQGESIFKVYAKLADFSKKHYNYVLTALETSNAFKEYSANNVSGKLKIIFSSDGDEGAWDILTMSQRGINSCQSWNGHYKNCTIGSVLDPFTAIMYLTSGSKTEFGTKMMRRCIVRFVVDSTIKRPCLFLEYMYPNEHPATMKAFKEALRAKTGGKFPIISQHNPSADRFYVPYSDVSKVLLKHSNPQYVNLKGQHNYYGIFPYRDTFIEYKLKEDDKPKDATYTDIRAKHMTEISNAFCNTDISETYISTIMSAIGTEIFDKIDIAACEDERQYVRMACIRYFGRRITITKTIFDKIAALMKLNKDKSIFIPGVSKKVAKNKTAAKNKPEKKDDIETTVEKHVMSIITEYFKNLWTNVVLKATKAKAKPKTNKRKAIV